MRDILVRFAQSDLRKAREQADGILISQTKQGLVELTYKNSTGIYTITSQDGGKFRKSGVNREMAAILADEIYVVVKQ